MPVYATHRDPTFGAVVPHQLFAPSPESLMSRRQLSFVVLTIASLIVTACGSSPTAPQRATQPTAPQLDTAPIGTVGSG
jgi:hypothetical protein